MPIPADISELRTRFARDFDSVARQYRERAGVSEPVLRAVPQAQAAEAPVPDEKEAEVTRSRKTKKAKSEE